MISIEKHLGLLGLRVRDRITGFTGVVASVSFDLYGCVQAIINPGLDKDGKLLDQCWFDANRLEVLTKKPVMHPPDFKVGPEAEGKKGPAEKPAAFKA